MVPYIRRHGWCGRLPRQTRTSRLANERRSVNVVGVEEPTYPLFRSVSSPFVGSAYGQVGGAMSYTAVDRCAHLFPCLLAKGVVAQAPASADVGF